MRFARLLQPLALPFAGTSVTILIGFFDAGGVALSTRFTVAAQGWSDTALPLSFAYAFLNSEPISCPRALPCFSIASVLSLSVRFALWSVPVVRELVLLLGRDSLQAGVTRLCRACLPRMQLLCSWVCVRAVLRCAARGQRTVIREKDTAPEAATLLPFDAAVLQVCRLLCGPCPCLLLL